MKGSEKTEVTNYKMLIDNKFTESVTGESFKAINPATSQSLGFVPKANELDINLSVEAADRAFNSGPWPKMGTLDRGRLLTRFALSVEANSEELALLETRDSGHTITDSHREIKACVNILDYYAGLATKILGTTIPNTPDTLIYTVREPVGVVGQIIPWNLPLLMFMTKVAPALAAGCTIIIKPASNTPLTALRVAQLAVETGIPPGVLNVVTGSGKVAGMALVKHPGIQKISFTGDTSTGKLIAQEASRHVKRISLELGGKSANIIFNDANIDAAVEEALRGIFGGAGQSCIAGSRILVQKEIYDQFISKFAKAAREIRVGDPLDVNTQMGSLVSQGQLSRVMEYVDIGRNEGAIVEAGGFRPDEQALAKGAFYTPTVLIKVHNKMRVAQEEIFGPVACVLTFKTEEEAVSIANDTPYGLAAGIWSSNLNRVHKVVRHLKAGTVWINSYRRTTVLMPFGGFKESGYGREYSLEGIDPYVEIKSIYMNME